MKRKYWFVVIGALLAAGGLWFTRSGSRSDESVSDQPTTAHLQVLEGPSKAEQTNNAGPHLAPPDQTRRFREFTPEQRVEQARKGHGPGG